MSQILWQVVFQHFLSSMEIFLFVFLNPNHYYNRHFIAACVHVSANEKQMRILFHQAHKCMK